MKQLHLPKIPLLLATTLALGLAAGCAHLPTQAAASYSDAFRGVAAVTEELLADYELAARHLATPDEPPAPDYPVQFDPAAILKTPPTDPAAEQYRRALAALEAYNQSLLDLAQRAPDTAISQHADALLSAFDAAGVASVPGAGELARELLSAIARARNRSQLAKAVSAHATTVERMLDTLTVATADFYRVRVGCIADGITETEFQHETVFAELQSIAREYAAPAPDAALALRRAQLESELIALRLSFAPNAPVRPLPLGATPYDDRAQDRLEEQLGLLRSLAVRRGVLAGQLRTYHDCLGRYVRLVSDTRSWFADLRTALDDPNTDGVRRSAQRIDTDATALLNSLRELRAALALNASTANPKGN